MNKRHRLFSSKSQPKLVNISISIEEDIYTNILNLAKKNNASVQSLIEEPIIHKFSTNTFYPIKLVEARKARGYDRVDASRATEIPVQRISRIETGNVTPTSGELLVFSKLTIFR